MRVEQITFRGFKSLHDLTLPLGDMTVLTGPNGSGKSNILAALEFLGSLYRVGLDRAVAEADGYDRIAYRREAGPALDLDIEVEARLNRTEVLGVIRDSRPEDLAELPEELIIRHELGVRAVAADPVSSFELGMEYLGVEDSLGDLWIEARRGEGQAGEVTLSQHPLGSAYDRAFPDGLLRGLDDGELSQDLMNLIFSLPGVEATSLINNASRYFSPLRVAREFLASLRYFQFVPQLCRRPALPGTDVRMGRHGEDLAAVAEHVRRHDEPAWQRVQEATIGVVPGLVRVDVVPTEDRRLTLQFHERGVLRPWRAAEVSDGTIQAFGLFAALYDRRMPLLAVEEPENALHPWILREFIDLCQAETSKQVLLTTHSPALINYVPGEWVNLVWRDEGKTRIGRLLDIDPDAKKLWESGEVGLFDIYDGGVVPHSVPGG